MKEAKNKPPEPKPAELEPQTPQAELFPAQEPKP